MFRMVSCREVSVVKNITRAANEAFAAFDQELREDRVGRFAQVEDDVGTVQDGRAGMEALQQAYGVLFEKANVTSSVTLETIPETSSPAARRSRNCRLLTVRLNKRRHKRYRG